jgi:signal transduction histidine kinase
VTKPAPYRILALDDEYLALNLVQRAFEEDDDVALFVSASPSEALEIARKQDIELVMSDQRMTEMSGLEFLLRFREVRPGAVRILLTAYPDLQVVLRAITEGLVYRFVLKPWDPDEMRITIRRAIEAKRVADENARMADQLRVQFEELVHAEKMAVVGRLVAGIGHELGNPVGSLVGNMELLESELGPVLERAAARGDVLSPGVLRKVQVCLASMRNASEQIYGIIGGLRRYSHPGAASPAPWDVNEGVKAALQLLGHRLKLHARVLPDLGAVPPIVCRGQEIVQVLVNLIANAADAVEARHGGAVSLKTREDGGFVRIEVADTGPGIPEHVKRQLFSPFVTTKAVGHGTGLGLSICKSIVDSHGGRIEVVSELGKGTSFTVVLPVVARVAAPAH